jgi:hypothetical protein
MRHGLPKRIAGSIEMPGKISIAGFPLEVSRTTVNLVSALATALSRTIPDNRSSFLALRGFVGVAPKCRE